MTRRDFALFFAAAVLLIFAAHLLDRWAYHALAYPPANERDWGRMLRIFGYAPAWAVAAFAFWLDGRRRRADSTDRAIESAKAIVVAVVIAGLLAEALKLLIRRNRPNVTLAYEFRPFLDHPMSSRGFGMPSSHAMVAFAGAMTLARQFPRMAPVLLALAAGCGLTRLMAQAHYLSDVVAAGFGGTLVGLIVQSKRAPISDRQEATSDR